MDRESGSHLPDVGITYMEHRGPECQTDGVTLRELWEANAQDWVRWTRTPGHDSYDQFHRRRFFEIVPTPGRLTLDVGCGEGRVSRDLASLGHDVVGLDGSPTMVKACATHEQPQPVVTADAARLPLRSGTADLAVAFMALHDVDDLIDAISEIGRVLSEGGRLCAAIVHPMNSAGAFAGDRDDASAPFVVEDSYLEARDYADDVERDGLPMTFNSRHRPLETYSRALESAGFVIDLVREVTVDDADDRWSRIPLFLHIRASLTGTAT